MDAIITNLLALAAYFGTLVAGPVTLAKGPAVVARIAAARTVLAYAYAAPVAGCTVADVLDAYKARKVTILDYGTSLVVMARYGRRAGKAGDYRFVVK